MPALTLKPKPPFDLHVTARHQTYYQQEFGADAYRDGVYCRALEIGGRPLLAVVRSTGTVESPELFLEVKGAPPSPDASAAAQRIVSSILALDVDLRPFYALARKDPFLHSAVETFYGLHPPRTASVFEALVMAIIGQQISGVVARAIRARIVRSLGTSFAVDGETFRTFPAAAAFLEAGHDRLRALGLSNRKAEYILDIATRAAEGSLDFQRMETLSNQELMEELVLVRGIGPWTVQWVLLRALGRSDAFPAGDLALRRAISEHYFAGRDVTPKEATAFAQEHWGTHCGLATTYLFAYIRHQRATGGGREALPGG